MPVQRRSQEGLSPDAYSPETHGVEERRFKERFARMNLQGGHGDGAKSIDTPAVGPTKMPCEARSIE